MLKHIKLYTHYSDDSTVYSSCLSIYTSHFIQKEVPIPVKSTINGPLLHRWSRSCVYPRDRLTVWPLDRETTRCRISGSLVMQTRPTDPLPTFQDSPLSPFVSSGSRHLYPGTPNTERMDHRKEKQEELISLLRKLSRLYRVWSDSLKNLFIPVFFELARARATECGH